MKGRSRIWCALIWGAQGCSSAYEGDSIPVTGPTSENFGKVAQTLDYFCGNLACHGSTFRNLRLYGDQGRRLDAKDIPCGVPTTPDEVQADYRALVSLEPEIMAAVVASDGTHPERLTLVRKARGLEKHTGGTVFRDGTDQTACVASCKADRGCSAACYGDRCLVSWIAGAVDVSACSTSLPETRCNPL